MKKEEAIRRIEFCRNFLANHYSDMGEPNITAFNMAIKALEQEPRTAHWIAKPYGNMLTKHRWECSECLGEHTDPETGKWHEVFDYKYPYCPNCGAKMVEPQESEE